MRKSFETFEEEANKKHNKKYSYIKDTFKNMTTQMSIKCPKHEIFEQKPSKHLYGQGCPKCYGFKKSNTEIIEEFKKIHGNIYDYSETIYKNNLSDIIIICNNGHDRFLQTPKSHLRGNGCPKCGINKRAKLRQKDNETFIFQANQVHNKIYDYSLTNYDKSDIKVKIICKLHGVFEQKPNSHLIGQGCEKCSYILRKENARKSNELFLEQANLIHNNKYDYSKTHYTNDNTDVIIICVLHGEFKQRPSSHLRQKSGCPLCSKSKQYSNAQIQWINFIQLKDNITIQHAENIGEFKIPNTTFKADGYCQETNTIYEYHGDFWHGNPDKYVSHHINPITKKTFGELYQETLKREMQIRDMGFNLITIWENDWIKLNKCIRILQKKYRNL